MTHFFNFKKKWVLLSFKINVSFFLFRKTYSSKSLWRFLFSSSDTRLFKFKIFVTLLFNLCKFLWRSLKKIKLWRIVLMTLVHAACAVYPNDVCYNFQILQSKLNWNEKNRNFNLFPILYLIVLVFIRFNQLIFSSLFTPPLSYLQMLASCDA